MPKALAEDAAIDALKSVAVVPDTKPTRPDLSRLVVKGAREHNLRNVDLDLPGMR